MEEEGVNGSELSAADQKKKECISREELYEAVMDMVRLTPVYLGMVMLLPENGNLLVFFGKVNQGLEKMRRAIERCCVPGPRSAWRPDVPPWARGGPPELGRWHRQSLQDYKD